MSKIIAKNYDVKKLRADLKKSIGTDGLTRDHLGLKDSDLLKEYVRIYGKEELEAYKSVETISFGDAVRYNLQAFKDSLLGIASGKVYVLEGNSIGGDREYEDVYLTKQPIGYVMMGLKSKIVLPIARDDEHHKGFDLVFNLIDKGLIPKDKYFPIFALGSDYLHEDDFKYALTIYKRWLDMGGPNIVIEDWHGSKEGFMIDLRSFVEKEGKGLKPRKGSLSVVGKTLISSLTELSLSGIALRKSANPDADFKKYAVVAKKLINFAEGPMYFRCQLSQALKNTKFKDRDDLVAEINKPTKPALELLQEIEEIIFGMTSFKKIIHDDIRENMAKPGFDFKDLVKIFGDLPKAFDALGRI